VNAHICPQLQNPAPFRPVRPVPMIGLLAFFPDRVQSEKASAFIRPGVSNKGGSLNHYALE